MDNARLSEEDVERIRAMYPTNTADHLRRARRLLKSAKPGNLPWKMLENEYGFSGDYVPGQDEGEPPQGAKW